jgi:hypothetical protein
MVDAELCLQADLLLSDNTVRLNYKDQVWLRLRTLEGADVQRVCVCVCVCVAHVILNRNLSASSNICDFLIANIRFL